MCPLPPVANGRYPALQSSHTPRRYFADLTKVCFEAVR